jgi:uncharacterized protein
MPSAPVQPNQRIQYLDVVRGFAITGVLLAYVSWNLGTRSSSDYTLFDNIIDQAAYYLIDSKCYTLLACLFTVGFILHMDKPGDKIRSLYIYRRRLLGILIIGILHALLLRSGDILVPYALLTFIASFFYRSNRTIIIVMSLLLVIEILLPQAWISWGLSFPQRPAGLTENYWIENFRWLKWRYALSIFLWEDNLILLLAGLLLGKIFIQNKSTLSNRQLKMIIVGGLVAGTGAYLVTSVYSSLINSLPDIGNTHIIRATAYRLLDLVHRVGMASAYASIFFLLTRHFRLMALANLGRMSLTNYIMQSTIMVPFCLAFNLFDHITPTLALVMIATIWTLQVLFSKWWLKHHQFGPLEWLLRRFTYGRTLIRKKENDQIKWIPEAVVIEE